MSASIVKSILAFCLLSTLVVGMVFAQEKAAKTPAQDPSTYMHLHAPFAQSLVEKVKAAHNDQILKLGIHAVPPGETDDVIIANVTLRRTARSRRPRTRRTPRRASRLRYGLRKIRYSIC